MTHYEITYIIRPSFEDPQVDELAARMAAVAKENGGDGIGVERMGKKRLAYELKKMREGHYVCMRFAGSADCAKEVIRQLRLHDDVLRALLVKNMIKIANAARRAQLGEMQHAEHSSANQQHAERSSAQER